MKKSRFLWNFLIFFSKINAWIGFLGVDSYSELHSIKIFEQKNQSDIIEFLEQL
jgi:hypothetical protein